MACKKYSIVNTGLSPITFNYRRCDNGMWEYQEVLYPNEQKNIWFIPGTFSSASNIGLNITDEGTFPPVPPSPTPSTSPATPTPTPTNTSTPTPTPTITETPTLTPSETPTQTPTQTPTLTPSSTPPPPFVSIWSIPTNGDTITLPLVSNGTYDFIVDWGDGNVDQITSWDQSDKIHPYDTSGSYTVKIYGTINGFSFNNSGDCLKLIEITQWGVLRLGNNGRYFFGCENLILSNVSDNLNLVGTTNLSFMFANCYSIDTAQYMEYWDISNVIDMHNMFMNCTLFNHDITGWNVSSIQDMSGMFSSTQNFNQDISTWERVSPDISTLANVSNMSGMFYSSYFNQDISNWDVSGVQNMSGMFELSHYNKPLNNWSGKTSNVVDMSNMFNGSYSFNQPISNWNVSRVMNMTSMFEGSQFNQDISTWERVSPDISTLANVSNTSSMFKNNTVFNYPLNGWDVSSVENMQEMFRNATDFNQPISGWNVSNVGNFTGFMSGKSSSDYSQENIESLLCTWKDLPYLYYYALLDLGSINLSPIAFSCYNFLSNTPYYWTINYGSLVYSAELASGTTSGDSCSNITTSTYWTNNSGNFYTLGYTWYTDYGLTSIANAGYYSNSTNWIQLDGSGVVIDTGLC
jgi:surface protein